MIEEGHFAPGMFFLGHRRAQTARLTKVPGLAWCGPAPQHQTVGTR
jgi:hypothetical protein